MKQQAIDKLLHIKSVIDHLKAIDEHTLSERERYAVRDTLAQAYIRASYLLIPILEDWNKQPGKKSSALTRTTQAKSPASTFH